MRGLNGFNFSIGADPEVFVKDVTTDSFIGAEGLVAGDKHNPFPVQNGAVQVDGMALEFNINPSTSQAEFTRNIFGVMNQLDQMIGPNLALVPQATALFSDEEWGRVSDFSKILGCEPDFNAYTGKENPKPNADVKFRTGAGHIHIGWCDGVDPHSEEHFETCRLVAKQMDLHLGIWSLFQDPDDQRRLLYGKAGAFRPKPYGVEYRTLSNFWLKSRKLTNTVYGKTRKALMNLQDPNSPDFECWGSAKIGIDSNSRDYSKDMLGGYCV